jgi:predicted ester cyclase
MSTETNKEVVRRFVNEVFVRLDPTAVDELVADDFESHSWPSKGNAKESLKATTQGMRNTLDEIRFEIDDLIAEGDRVAARLTAGARQIGPFMGIEPAGKSYEIGEIHIFRLRDGQIVEHWHQMDAMALMTQLKGEASRGAATAA